MKATSFDTKNTSSQSTQHNTFVNEVFVVFFFTYELFASCQLNFWEERKNALAWDEINEIATEFFFSIIEIIFYCCDENTNFKPVSYILLHKWVTWNDQQSKGWHLNDSSNEMVAIETTFYVSHLHLHILFESQPTYIWSVHMTEFDASKGFFPVRMHRRGFGEHLSLDILLKIKTTCASLQKNTWVLILEKTWLIVQ